MYLFVLFLILNIIYFIFGWKHDLYSKYKHESCFIKIRLYSTYVNFFFFNYPMVNILS